MLDGNQNETLDIAITLNSFGQLNVLNRGGKPCRIWFCEFGGPEGLSIEIEGGAPRLNLDMAVTFMGSGTESFNEQLWETIEREGK